MLRRLLRPLAPGLAVLALGAAAAPAQALTVTPTTTANGTTFTITGDGGANLVSVTGPNPGVVRVTDTGPVPYDAAFAAAAPYTLVVSLGGGDDTFISTLGVLNVDGGAGNDTLSGDGFTGSVLAGGDGNDTFLPNPSFGWGAATLNVTGGAGHDTVSFAGSPVPVVARLAGSANGLTIASDVEGLVGGDGADSLSGGPGADTLSGGPGADSLEAADGVTDTVDCGDAFDVVHADPVDVLTACEGVTLTAAPPAPPLPPTPAPAPTAPGTPTSTAVPGPAFAPMVLGPVTLSLPRKPMVFDASASSTPVTVSCAADGPARCRGDVRITLALSGATATARAARVHGKTVTLAHGRFSVARGRSAKVNAKVWRRGVRQALDDAKQQGSAKPKRTKGKQVLSAKMKADVTVTTTGADGKVRHATRHVTVSVQGRPRG